MGGKETVAAAGLFQLMDQLGQQIIVTGTGAHNQEFHDLVEYAVDQDTSYQKERSGRAFLWFSVYNEENDSYQNQDPYRLIAEKDHQRIEQRVVFFG